MPVDEVRVNIPSKTESHDNKDELVTMSSEEQAARDIEISSKEKVENETSPPQDSDLYDDQSIGQVDFIRFCRLISQKDWEGAYEILKEEYLTARISDNEFNFAKGDTALHIAVKVGADRCLRELVNLMEKDDLAIENHDGNTAFFIAAATGNVAFAKLMINKNDMIPNKRGENKMLPIHEAAQNGHRQMVKLLNRVTKKDEITKEDRIELLRILISKTGLYGPGSNNLPEEERLPPPEDLVQRLWNPDKIIEFAVEEEPVELVILISHVHPDLISKVHGDICGKILRNVVLKRRKYTFKKLVKNLTPSFKKAIVLYEDSDGNNFLHLAAKLASSDELDDISGVALQLQHELLWFKEVEKYVNPWDAVAENHRGETPKALFNKEHEKLRENGEKWMKDTANSCMIVAALIATVVFAAAFTVPGGTKEGSGTPHFVYEVSFKIFIISDAISLILSVCSILTFLSILTSRYAEDDFLLVLPRKLAVGLSTLLLSIAAMMVVFCATIFIVLKDEIIWVPILVGVIASLPVFVFIKQQWQLLSDVLTATSEVIRHQLDDNDDEHEYYKYGRQSFLIRCYKHCLHFFTKHFPFSR